MSHSRRRITFAPLLLLAAVVTLAVSDRILTAAGSSQGSQGVERVDVLIAFSSLPGRAEETLVRSAGGEIRFRYHLVPAIAARIPSEAVTALRANPRVTAIEPDGRVFALDVELDNTWGVNRIGAGPVHQSGVRGAGVKVAVIDTGIDYNHPDLAANYAGGFDFVNNDDDPFDDNKHGTHVAGTVAARDDDSGVVGVAPDATLYGLKVLDANGSGSFSGVIAALQWAVDNGVQITNNSYGSSVDPGATTQAAFDNSAAAGILHVAAAGNSGTCDGTGDNVAFPARYASVVAVAATDSNDGSPCFSSTGPDVELSGPGVSINSTVPGGGYQVLSGTSMASPHVAGTAALLLGQGVTDTNLDGRVNDEVRVILVTTAHDLGTPGRDTWYGYGLVDALAATGVDGARDPAVTVVLTTDKSTYIKGTDSAVQLTAVVKDENGDAIAGLLASAFVTTLDGNTRTVAFSESTTAGRYTGMLDIASAATGSHTATVVVTDTRAVSGSDSASFTVAGGLRVTSISYRTYGGSNGKRNLSITAAIGDETGAPVAGASVSVRIWKDGVLSYARNGSSNSSGNATFDVKNAPAGCYVTTVSDVFANGRVWDGVTPTNNFCK